MLEKADGPETIRTVVRTPSPGVTTVLRTRGGAPEFVTTVDVNGAVEPEDVAYAVKCSMWGDDYGLTTSTAEYVSIRTTGSERSYLHDDWYEKYSYVSKWVGGGDVLGQTKTLINGEWDGGTWQGLSTMPYCTSQDGIAMGVPQYFGWATSLDSDGISSRSYPSLSGGGAKACGSAAHKPPGSPLLWFPWDVVAGALESPATPQFSCEYDAATPQSYGKLAFVAAESAHVANPASLNPLNLTHLFYRSEGGAAVLYGLRHHASSYRANLAASDTVFGKLVVVALDPMDEIVVDITYGALPSRYEWIPSFPAPTVSSYISLANKPLCVSKFGDEAVGIFQCGWKYVSGGSSTNVARPCIIRVNLDTKVASVATIDSAYTEQFTHVNGDATTKWHPYTTIFDVGYTDADGSYGCRLLAERREFYNIVGPMQASTPNGLFIGSTQLLSIAPEIGDIPAINGEPKFVQVPYSDIRRGLFVAVVRKHVAYSTDASLNVTSVWEYCICVVFKKRIVAKRGVTHTWFYENASSAETSSWVDGINTCCAAVGSGVETLSMLGGAVEAIKTRSERVYPDPMSPPYIDEAVGPNIFSDRPFAYASADVNAKGTKIVVSLSIGSSVAKAGTRSGSAVDDDAFSLPKVLNFVVSTRSGTVKKFGSDQHFYNRIHFQPKNL